jgi:HPt (histidine-containing phosphotransfer) domain-containing protein
LNTPLFRRYFRKGNIQLLALLRHGLDQNPINPDLLNNLGFYHIFSPILKELISRYSKACETEQDMAPYRQLAHDFHINCSASGYEALYALDETLQQDDPKKAVVRDLMSERGDEGIAF